MTKPTNQPTTLMKELLMDHSVRRLAALAAATALTTSAAAALAPDGPLSVAEADAAAGQLTVLANSLLDGTAIPAGPWSAGYNIGNVNSGPIGVQVPEGVGSGWSTSTSLSAPSGMTFASASIDAQRQQYNGWNTGQAQISTSWGAFGWTNNPPSGFGGYLETGNVSSTWAVSNPGSLSIAAYCVNGGACNATNALHQINRARYVLNDPNPPTGALKSGGGALLDGSWHTSPNVQLDITASDGSGESGVYRAFVRDGATTYYASVDPSNTRCHDPVANGNAYEFAAAATTMVPCRTASQDYSPTFDLSALGDGTFTGVSIGVEDASGREYTIASNRTLKVNLPQGALPDAGDVGPGGCIYQVDGTTCVVPIANTGLPTITGTAKVGQTLTAGNGTWTGASGATFTYEWQRNNAGVWAAIPGATSNSYTLTAADQTFMVRVKVTATVGGASQSACSTASGAVAEDDRGGSGGNGSGGGGGGGSSTKKDVDDPPAKPADDGTPKVDTPSSPGPQAPKSDPNGTPATRDATVSATFAGNGKTAVAATYTAGLRVRGTLKSAKGTPIANATVILWARNNTPGSKSVKLTTATTDSKGRYEATVPRGPSRKIIVSYTAFSGDSDPADTANLSVKVKAAAKLVTNVRTVRVGHGLRLRGRLAHKTQGGVMVLIGAMDGGQWRSFAHVRTDRKGRFHYTYKFKPGSEGRTFYFSALVDDRVYPFAAGFSNDARVRVSR
jgi:hypothetical protein